MFRYCPVFIEVCTDPLSPSLCPILLLSFPFRSQSRVGMEEQAWQGIGKEREVEGQHTWVVMG